MKPHPLRKTLSLANLVLAIAVVGVAGWFFTRVRPAVAQVTDQPKSYQPPEYAKLQQSYEGQRREGLAWQPDVPVSGEEIHTWILRADYARKDPPHWIFSGPMPPIKEADPVGVAAPSEPQGLESLGQVALVVYGTDESSLILFSFGSAGKSGVFRIGEWVRVDRGAEKIYRLTRISAGPQRAYKIHYAVHGQDKERPKRTGILQYESGAEVTWPPYLTLFSPGGPPRTNPRPPGTHAGGAEPGQPEQAPASERLVPSPRRSRRSRRSRRQRPGPYTGLEAGASPRS